MDRSTYPDVYGTDPISNLSGQAEFLSAQIFLGGARHAGCSNFCEKKKSFWVKVKKYKLLYLFLVPGVLYFVIFRFVPMFGYIIAFKDLAPFEGLEAIFNSEWVGLRHFKEFMSSYYFWKVFTNTIILAGLRLLVEFTLPIILALLLNEINSRFFKTAVQTISYMPYYVSNVVLASLDGAGKLNQIFKITLPCISFAIMIMFIMRIGVVIHEGWEETLLLYSPAVYKVSDILDTYVYRAGLDEFRYSYATAVALFKSVIGFTLVLITNLLAKRMGQQNMYT